MDREEIINRLGLISYVTPWYTGTRAKGWKDEEAENKITEALEEAMVLLEKQGGKVNHPEHYNKGIEVIDYIESHNMNFNQGNIIKYVTRAEHKGEKKQDLEKAKWYINRELKRYEK